MNSRSSKAKINIIVSFICQILTIICGFVVPQLFIKGYGSEAYGLTSSITQFLAFITLLEGGVAGVARAALYKPLADNDSDRISAILYEIKRYFRGIGFVFCIYVLVLACSYQYISKSTEFDWLFSFLMVLVISISTFAQYFIGISYAVLLQASQRQYVTNLINIGTMVINTLAIVLLVYLDFNLIIVKLVSSLIFVCRPLLMASYVKKLFPLKKTEHRDKTALANKWTAFGQHIAFFLHSNTDVAVLTVFGNLKMVAVYSVYHMVVSAIQSITQSFTAGMEAVFGDMLAKKEITNLQKTFGYYDTLISYIAVVLFSVTAILIVPFVKIYTSGVTDANYIEPSFAMLLIIAGLLFCIRLPYHSVIIAAGHFKETRVAAYGEAITNICVSIILVIKFGLIGVAIGTVAAVSFRFVFYAIYLTKNIIHLKISLILKRLLLILLSFVSIFWAGEKAIGFVNITGYFNWLIAAVIAGIVSLLLYTIISFVFYKNDMMQIIKKLKIGKK